jgi:hypothetical protein
MAKFIEFEVSTPIALDNAGVFFGAIDAASKPFESGKSEQLYRSWGTGELVEGHDTSLHVIDPSKLRYIHTTRLVDPVRVKVPNALDFFLVARKYDPRLQAPEDSDAENLQATLGDELFNLIGRRTLEGISMPFNYIDVIESNKNPSEIVFALRQEPSLLEPEQSEQVFSGELPLQIVTNFIRAKVKEASPVVHGLLNMNKGTTEKTIEDSLPFAWTKETNPGILNEFVATLTYNLFDPYIQTHPSGNIQISSIT